jgi:hypothetical protein
MNPVLPTGVEGFLYDPQALDFFRSNLQNLGRFLPKQGFIFKQRKIQGGNTDGHLDPNLSYSPALHPWENKWKAFEVSPGLWYLLYLRPAYLFL